VAHNVLLIFKIKLHHGMKCFTDDYLHVDVVMEQLKELMFDFGIQIQFIQNEF
jgi:hypothetical protein